ncbi:short subunit dehydrogenase [Kordia periserrulae]|uniref:Short subunit dehydrogenase n=1 Tax=Kordia periserrulae TaxID=701523 RepID=A0A2T6BT10_9FLAO|nr:SDR family NAD(P)-dependent oxidoreductase [Kordia periserrulae]PTX59202.1 short subunit dehydrogenase [Kordia periserrulae]
MKNDTSTYNFSQEEWETCLKVLHALKKHPLENPDNQQFGSLITKIYSNAKKANRKQSYSDKKQADLQTILNSEISKNALENTTKFSETEEATQTYTKLHIPKNCYSCNASFVLAHSFYNRLCPTCAELNYKNRFKTLNLSNRKVIITGGRVKIGYATALKMLRFQANVIVTTRFPATALAQFQQEKDYHDWKDNLVVYGLDLRNLKSVENFINYYKNTYNSLDILINNAAQTIKYTDQYYAPLIENEQQLLQNFSKQKQLIANETPVANVKLLENHVEKSFVALNRFGQPVDNRAKNSWNATLEEISMQELIEVNLINQISPYFLIKELLPLLKNSSFSKKYIINVTSSEGQFSYHNKTMFHPHTNMTKAALNMMTRTSAEAFSKDKIYMNAVDVGWISTGAREELREKQFQNGYIPPLDPVDGAARIVHPIYENEQNNSIFIGKLLKNYKIENW